MYRREATSQADGTVSIYLESTFSNILAISSLVQFTLILHLNLILMTAETGAGHQLIKLGRTLYLYGGFDGKDELGDLWSWELPRKGDKNFEKSPWRQIESTEDESLILDKTVKRKRPRSRSCHQLAVDESTLIDLMSSMRLLNLSLFKHRQRMDISIRWLSSATTNSRNSCHDFSGHLYLCTRRRCDNDIGKFEYRAAIDPGFSHLYG
jgi:hypothetical protein